MLHLSLSSRHRHALALLRPRAGFLIGELRGGTRRYHVGDAHVLLRHRSRDIDIVNEIWGPDREYEPPERLAGRLSRPGLRVIDLGANIGLFGAFALTRWDVASLTSFEPDPANLALLRRVRALNGADDRWTVHGCAVANFAGEMEFVALGSPESRRPGPGEPSVSVPVRDIFEHTGPIDLLKVDIEGGEWALLEDERLAGFAAEVIVMEWHWRDAPAGDAHAAALDALVRAGYRIDSDQPGHVPGIGMVWASRP